MYRHTYVKINLDNIETNVKKLVSFLSDYKYHIGVVKADVYGHGQRAIKPIIDGGCNYLACATLEEALKIRKKYSNIPILCLGIIPIKYLQKCLDNNIAITVSDLQYAKNINVNNIKCHIKINTGMNRLGLATKEGVNEVFRILKSKCIIEGIYTHMYHCDCQEDTLKQVKKFESICQDIDLKKIPIIHFGASGYALNYEKPSYVNGCRFGIAMYGLIPNILNLQSTFSVYSTVIYVNEVKNESVGYNGAYVVKNKERIAIVAIGYADGVLRINSGRYVFINNKKYPIVGNICMDMLFIKVDDSVKTGDKVAVIKDNEHIIQIANYLSTIPYEVICSISKRVPKVY